MCRSSKLGKTEKVCGMEYHAMKDADSSVADEDIPDTARVPPKSGDEEEAEEKPKKSKKGGKKAKAETNGDDEGAKAKKPRKSAEKSTVSTSVLRVKSPGLISRRRRAKR